MRTLLHRVRFGHWPEWVWWLRDGGRTVCFRELPEDYGTVVYTRGGRRPW